MKNFALTIILICLGLTSYSQKQSSFKFGVKGGVNMSKLKFNSMRDLLDNENRKGYYAGIWARIGGSGTYLQPELYLSGKNATIISPSGHENDVKFTSLDLPVLLGTKFGGTGLGVRVNTGPVFTLFLDKEQRFEQAAPAIFRSKFKDKAIAWQFGLGLDIGNISIDGRYETGLSKLNSEIGYPTTKLNVYTIGLGFAIF